MYVPNRIMTQRPVCMPPIMTQKTCMYAPYNDPEDLYVCPL